jgi:hypothetical protein
MKNKAQKLIVVIILANLVFANFAFAQTPLPSTNLDVTPSTGPIVNSNDTILTKSDFTAAQRSQQDCMAFKVKVLLATASLLKANWNERYGSCFITDSDKPDGYIGIMNRSGIAENFQIRLANLNENPAAINSSISGNDVVTQHAEAQKQKTSANGLLVAVGWILDSLLSVIAVALAAVTALAGSIFNYAVDQIINVTTMPAIVDIGWGIVRDICNMFFILILIVIGLAAILRIERYDYRHLLGELILMAILVNFSKVIAVTIINFVNVIAAMFYAEGMGVDIFKTLMQIADPAGDFKSIVNGGWMAGVTLGLGKIVYMIVGAVVFLALAGLFIIRLVGLYVLVIFSPIAYIARILPATEKFSEEWWQYFVKYLIWAPVALFMIRLNIVVVENNFASWFSAGPNGGAVNDSAFIYFILCAFLAAAFLVAEEAGMVGSKLVVGAAEKGLHFGWEAADKWLARGANRTAPGRWNATRRGLSYLSLGAWKQGWQQRSKQSEHESYIVAAGKRQDTFNKLISPIPGQGHKTDYGLKAEQQLVADEKKQIHTKNNEELINGIEEKLHAKEGEAAFAYAEALFENSDGNEVLSKWGYGTDHEGFRRFIDDNFVPVLGKDRSYRLAYDLSRRAEDAGHWNFARAYTAEKGTDGKMHYIPNANAGAEVQAEIAKMNPQQADRTLNRLARGFMEIDTNVEEIPVVEIVEGKVRFARYKDGDEEVLSGVKKVDEIKYKKGRINLGVNAYGHEARRTTDPKAAGRTFNLNTASNDMFNDSEETFKDNKPLWIALAAKFSKMSDTQLNQARNIISNVGFEADRDKNGNFVRDSEGKIKYKPLLENEIQKKVFTFEQAYQKVVDGEITAADLADKDLEDLKAKLKEMARNRGDRATEGKLG